MSDQPGEGPVGPGVPPEDATTTKLNLKAPFPETRIGGERPRTSRVGLWAFGILAVLILAASLGYIILTSNQDTPTALQSRRDVPPPLVPYFERADQGDAGAMRMLGTMYYNGLNVRQDRKEGIRWYRKAAAAGSVAARKDLEQLGLASEPK